jgi:hypothetical protein
MGVLIGYVFLYVTTLLGNNLDESTSNIIVIIWTLFLSITGFQQAFKIWKANRYLNNKNNNGLE